MLFCIARKQTRLWWCYMNTWWHYAITGLIQKYGPVQIRTLAVFALVHLNICLLHDVFHPFGPSGREERKVCVEHLIIRWDIGHRPTSDGNSASMLHYFDVQYFAF